MQKKFQFRAVPMFLCFYNSHLVSATNNVWTPLDLAKHVVDSSERAIKGQFMPEGFTFAYNENRLLDPLLSPHLSLH